MVPLGKLIPPKINGVIVGLLIFFSTLYGCITTQLIPFLFIRPFSRRGWKLINQYASDTWFRFIIFLMEYWNGTKLIISGDEIPHSEPRNVLLMSNHPSEADWFFAWSLGWRKKSLGNVKICIKKEFQVVPGLGWSIDNLDYPFMSRKWEFDEALLKHAITSLKEDKMRVWFMIFPEGTDFSEAKQKRSWEVADQNGWPKFKNLLVPRTKGLTATVQSFRDYATHLYDMTVAYPNQEKPTFFTALNGSCPSVVNVPNKDDDIRQWCFDRFKEKDELLDYYKKHQKFPGASEEFEKPGFGIAPPIAFVIWTTMVLTCVFFFFTSSLARVIFFGGWGLFAIFAHSKAARRWRGLDPTFVPQVKKNE